jgi:hypothetical protein
MALVTQLSSIIEVLNSYKDIRLILRREPQNRLDIGLRVDQLQQPVRKALAAVFDLVVDTGGVPGVAVTAEGVLASSAFGSLRLWDIHGGDLLVHIPVDISPVPFATFDPDGSTLHYFDAGYVLRRFPLETEELIELAESRVTRGLTLDECRRYLDPADCG